MTLRATYRLQFTAAFRFKDAAAIAPYLADLGISHVYASPIFAARPGSTHGYDVTDPNRLNPELGTEADFRAMAAAFRTDGLGLILDIVPNHMGIGGATNRFWLDVLEWGAASPHAPWFDIDWQAPYPGLAGKLLMPFLGAAYGDVLADGGLRLRADREEGSFAVWAHETHKLPVTPRGYGTILRAGGLVALADLCDAAASLPPTDPVWSRLKASISVAPEAEVARAVAAFDGRPGDAASWAPLDALIGAQHWRPAKFNLDGDALNYRRFFTISDLAGVRVELPEVFDATHRLILALIDEGLVDGVRIDHIDGLRDPKAYARRLRARAGRRITLHVEKILARDEHLPDDWQTDGTTGYEFANLLAGLLADPAGTEALSATYADFTGRHEPPGEIVHAAKRAILARPMAGELEAIVARLLALAAADPRRRDLGRGPLRDGLAAVIAGFDVYRTYADADGLPPEGRARLDAALADARARNPALDPDVLDFLAEVLGLARDGALEIAARVQQLSGPVMAKGLEDTALYRYNRLIALNEVGSEPGAFILPVDEFHRANAERHARFPRALLATSTHDTKRGEDARARILALASHADAWRAQVFAWHALLADPAAPIDPNEEYFFYQLLLGAWPADLGPDDPPPADLAPRVTAAMLKSAREAGVNTRWVFGDPAYEARLAAFVARAFDPARGFLGPFAAFAAELAPAGAALGLAQTLLKLTVPGVPDIYQGAELWKQSLVDPDNRRAIDFAARAALLADPAATPPKLALTAALLRLRATKPALFAEGSYEPIPAEGLVAFARRHGPDALIVAAPLPGRRPPDRPLTPPAGITGPWRDALGGPDLADLAPASLFATRPCACVLATSR